MIIFSSKFCSIDKNTYSRDRQDSLLRRAAVAVSSPVRVFCFTHEYLRTLKDLRVVGVILQYFPTKVTKVT